MSQRRRKAARSLTSQMTSIYWQEILVKEELPLKCLYADGILFRLRILGSPRGLPAHRAAVFPPGLAPFADGARPHHSLEL